MSLDSQGGGKFLFTQRKGDYIERKGVFVGEIRFAVREAPHWPGLRFVDPEAACDSASGLPGQLDKNETFAHRSS